LVALSPAQFLEKYADRTFDSVHGTETRTFADLNTLSITGANQRHGERYQPSPVYSLRRLLKRVVGVEFSADLHTQAQKNIERYGKRQADTVVSVHADATEFALPQDDLVLYFFNPFNAPVLSNVLDNLLASLQANPRRVILIYLCLPDMTWLDKLATFTCREKWHNYVVLETRRSSAVPMSAAGST
jgi:hypothetical protein